MFIEVTKLEEAGFKSAMKGLSLNKNQPIEAMPGVAGKLKNKDGGHNKFLEHIVVWVLVTAPRYWWQDADTYRLTTKQSESTNHTILKRPLHATDFEDGDISEGKLDELNELIAQKNFLRLKKKLPEGFLQTREWRLDYKTIRNMILQRRNHKLPHWPSFLCQLKQLCDYANLLPNVIPQKFELNVSTAGTFNVTKTVLYHKVNGEAYRIVRAWKGTPAGVMGLINEFGNVYIGEMSFMPDAHNIGYAELCAITGGKPEDFYFVEDEE